MLKRFLNDERGHFALMFSILSFPLLTSAGMAIEYANLVSTQSKLQNSIDAAALFAGRYLQESKQQPTVDSVTKFIQANFDGPVKNVTLKRNNDRLFVSAGTKAPAYFFGHMSPELFELGAQASVPYAENKKYEIVLVLDTTGSMSLNGKIGSLKKVAKNFLDDLKAHSDKGADVKIGIVPFSNHVNVGLKYASASWLDKPADKLGKREYCRRVYKNPSSTKCQTQTRYKDGQAYQVDICTGKGPSKRVCETRKWTMRWEGCVGSRDMPHTFRDGGYTARIPGILGGWHCGAELTELTSNFNVLKKSVNKLVARGNTYIAPGVMWGLRVLSNQRPFRQGSSDPRTVKVMILMTDGDNSRSKNVPHSASNYGSNIKSANNDTKHACRIARKAKVEIYSIAFGNNVSDTGKTVMIDCAGSNSRFFSAQDSSALQKAFDSIRKSFLKLRLTS